MKKGAGFGFFDLEDGMMPPKQDAPSEQVLVVKKRGRPRKEVKEEPAADTGKKTGTKKDKEEAENNKRVKKSHSVGLEAAAHEPLFVEKRADSQTKKRGRPRKTPAPEDDQQIVEAAPP